MSDVGRKVAGNSRSLVQMEVVGINGKVVDVKVSVMRSGVWVQEMSPQYLMVGDCYIVDIPLVSEEK